MPKLKSISCGYVQGWVLQRMGTTTLLSTTLKRGSRLAWVKLTPFTPHHAQQYLSYIHTARSIFHSVNFVFYPSSTPLTISTTKLIH